MRSLRLGSMASLCFLWVACGGSSDSDNDNDVDAGSDSGGAVDVIDSDTDPGADTTPADVAPGEDTTPDVAPDVMPDVAPDVMPDVAPDVMPDTEPDVAPDATPDVVEPPAGPFECVGTTDSEGMERGRVIVIDSAGRPIVTEFEYDWWAERTEITYDEFGRVVEEAQWSWEVDRPQEGGALPTRTLQWRSSRIIAWEGPPPSQARRETSFFVEDEDETAAFTEENRYDYEEGGALVREEHFVDGTSRFVAEYERDWNGDFALVRRDQTGDGTWDLNMVFETDGGGLITGANVFYSDREAIARWELVYDELGRWVERRYTFNRDLPWTEIDLRTWLSPTSYEVERYTSEGGPLDTIRVIEFDPITKIHVYSGQLYTNSCYYQYLLQTPEGMYAGNGFQSWPDLSGEACVNAWRDEVEPASFGASEVGPFGSVREIGGPAVQGAPQVERLTTYLEEGFIERRTEIRTLENGDEEGRTVIEASVTRDAAGRLTRWELDIDGFVEFREWDYDDEGILTREIPYAYRQHDGETLSGWVQEVFYMWDAGRRTGVDRYGYPYGEDPVGPDSVTRFRYDADFPYAYCTPDGEVDDDGEFSGT